MLVPYTISITGDGFVGFLTIFGFGILLVIGLFYEWVRGALSWPVWCYYTNEISSTEIEN
jgi:NADH:ubiquinone oxidoreductase subunit 3 (subunit A)